MKYEEEEQGEMVLWRRKLRGWERKQVREMRVIISRIVLKEGTDMVKRSIWGIIIPLKKRIRLSVMMLVMLAPAPSFGVLCGIFKSLKGWQFYVEDG